MKQLHSSLSIALIAASSLSLMALTPAQGMSDRKGATGEQVKVCLQKWKNNDITRGNHSRTQRLALLRFRACVHLATSLNRQNKTNTVTPPPFSAPSVTILSPNGGETFTTGSPITVNWQTVNVPSSHVFEIIRLRSHSTGQEFNVATNVVNDGNEMVVPSDVPTDAYTLEIKTYVNGTLVMDASDDYFKIVNPSVPRVSEQIKCVFHGSTTEQTCYTATQSDSPLWFSCTGINTCGGDIEAPMGTPLTWKSSCGGYAYTTMDGTSEYANFDCSNSSGH